MLQYRRPFLFTTSYFGLSVSGEKMPGPADAADSVRSPERSTGAMESVPSSEQSATASATQTRTVRNVNVEHRTFDSRVVPEYSGGREVAEWFDRFRGLCDRRGVDFVTVLPERLTGAAYATWNALTAEEQSSADTVRTALLDAFMPSWAEAYEEFQDRKLRPGETVEEYLQALRGLAALFIDGPVPDSLLDAKFVSGLPEGARLRMKVGTRSERMGLREMLRVARGVEVTVGGPQDTFAAAAGRQLPMSPPPRDQRRSPRRCWTCGRTGHLAAACPSRDETGRRRRSPEAEAENDPNGQVAAPARARSLVP